MIAMRDGFLQRQRQQFEQWAKGQHSVFTLAVTGLTIIVACLGYALGIRTVNILLLLGTVFSAWHGGFEPGMFTAIASIVAVYILGAVPDDAAAIHIPLFLVLAIIVSTLEQTRIETGQALKDAKEQLEVILNGVGDSISAQEPDGTLIFANEAAARFSGVQNVSEMRRQPPGKFKEWFHFFAEDGRPFEFEELPNRQVLVDKKTHEMVYRTIHLPTGAERWAFLRSSPLLDERGNVTMIINIFRDVSEAKRTADELARLNRELTEQSARLSNLVKNIPGAVWEITVQEGKLPQATFINTYIEKLLGYDEQALLAKQHSWDEDIHPDDRENNQRAMAEVMKGSTAVFAYRVRHRDGRYIHVESYCTMATDDHGGQHFYGVTMDISQRKQTEQALLQQAEDLRRSNYDLQQFAYVASHDLQEPLRMVTSYLQLVEQRYAPQLDSDAHEFIGYAVDGSNRMKALIQDLLAYSRVETANREFAIIRTQDAIDMAVQNLHMAFEDTRAELVVDELPAIRADQNQIAQLFQNLMANAIKFKSEKPLLIRITCEREGEMWHFKVSDNGIGIEPQHLERIFVIFQRLHTRAKYPGTGIGLAICKRVIERHGGKIWAESALHAGTTIHFTLPGSLERPQ